MKKSMLLAGLCVFCWVCQTAEMRCGADETPRFSQIAKGRVIPPGAPVASDVVMRSLIPRPASANDPHDSLAAIRGFHATRLEWTYGDNVEFIKKVHALGVWYGGAAAAGSYEGKEPHEKWNILTLDGKPAYASWVRTWANPNKWGCPNNPEFRAGHLRAVCRVIDSGADGLQRDEQAHAKNALRWGTCFCEHCIVGFRKYLQEKGDGERIRALGVQDLASFDYAEYLRKKNAPVGDAFFVMPGDYLKEAFYQFQLDATVEFHQWWRAELNRYAGRPVSVSCNNGGHAWDDAEQVFDFGIGELSAVHAQPAGILASMRRAAEFGKTQTVTMPLYSSTEETPEWVQHIRQAIATVYAAGGHIEAPWDTYLPTPKGDRFFGKPAQYADLYAFVRAMASFLDGYEDAYAVGPNVTDVRWGKETSVLSFLKGSDRVFAFARALPGKENAPVVVHLTDWKATPAPFTLSLNPLAFFGQRPLRIRLFTPAEYDRAVHEKAFEAKDYKDLAQSTELARGYVNTLEIPALHPWGILVVEPNDAAPQALWQPTFSPDVASMYKAELIVRISCATPRTEIRYTIDGTEPTVDSPLYGEPLHFKTTTSLQARAFASGMRPSVTAAAEFRPVASVNSLRPDDPKLKEHLVLWLQASSLSATLQDGDPVKEWQAEAGPSALATPRTLLSGKMSAPPTFREKGMDGTPCVEFDGVDDLIGIESFANAHLAGKPFTVVVVSQAEDNQFGLGGNINTGQGGAPRLYMTRCGFIYDKLEQYLPLGPAAGARASFIYEHDGQQARTFLDGVLRGTKKMEIVSSFEGGSLSIPLWVANENRSGRISSVVVFNRVFGDAERAGVLHWLARHSGISTTPLWE